MQIATMKTKAGKSIKQVALMRGINVGGNNMLPMADLAKMFTKAGCSNVQTYIQSGNVIFCAEPDLKDQIAKLISAQIAKKFGCEIPVVLRTVDEMETLAANNPFLKTGVEEERIYVMFLADWPAKEKIAQLDAKRSPGDEFILRGRDIYLRLGNGAARTKLTNAYFDSKLGTVSTMRNWRTVLKLREMMKA